MPVATQGDDHALYGAWWLDEHFNISIFRLKQTNHGVFVKV